MKGWITVTGFKGDLLSLQVSSIIAVAGKGPEQEGHYDNASNTIIIAGGTETYVKETREQVLALIEAAG